VCESSLLTAFFCCEDAGESFGRFDSLSLGNESEDQVQLFLFTEVFTQVFSACDFIAAITQHNPDMHFQMVRYYGWYSNKMRGQRRKREEEAQEEAARKSAATAEQGCGAGASAAIEIIEHRESKPQRIPLRPWRELIKFDHASSCMTHTGTSFAPIDSCPRNIRPV